MRDLLRAGLLTVLFARVAAAQDRPAELGPRLLEQPAVRAALEAARRGEPQTEDQVRLCEVPAPPFQEQARAALEVASDHIVHESSSETIGALEALLPHPFDLVVDTLGYGARAGRAYIRSRAGNRFAIGLRKSHEGGGPRIVVEGVEANAFQYMTGGVGLVLGPAGFNLGAGMTGGVVYLLDADLAMLNRQ